MLEQLSQAYHTDAEKLLEVANACARSYCELTGYEYKPFDLSSEDFRLNLAGLIATVAAAQIVAHFRTGSDKHPSKEEHIWAVLYDYHMGDCTPSEVNTFLICANATWNASMVMRQKYTPQQAINRLNVAGELPERDVILDKAQVDVCVQWLLRMIPHPFAA